MQYFYIGTAIRGAIYRINVICCSEMNTVNLNVIAVIINLHNQFTINYNQCVMQSICNKYNKTHNTINSQVI